MLRFYTSVLPCAWQYRWGCIKKLQIQWWTRWSSNTADVFGGVPTPWTGIWISLPAWQDLIVARILCVKSGNPISIHDGDIDARWPSPLEELDLNPVVPTILAHYTQLSRILGKIGQDIYRKQHKSGTTLLASVQSIMEDLDKWRQAIPQQLILEASSFQYNVARENISIFLHYYQCVIMTCRPLLYRICKKRLEELAAGTAPATWQRGLSPSVIHIINHSLTAARDATTAMDAASRQNLFGELFSSMCVSTDDIQQLTASWTESMLFRQPWCL